MSARLFDRCPRGHAKVLVSYGVVKNQNQNKGGFLPVYRVNTGPWHGHTFWPRGLDRDEAKRAARGMAEEAAERYIGDQCVAIRSVARTTGALTTKRRR